MLKVDIREGEGEYICDLIGLMTVICTTAHGEYGSTIMSTAITMLNSIILVDQLLWQWIIIAQPYCVLVQLYACVLTPTAVLSDLYYDR